MYSLDRKGIVKVNINPIRKARRNFCATSAALAAQPITSTFANTTLLAQTLSDDVTQYVKLGEHRVGTDVESNTAQWLQQRLQDMGFATQLDRFSVRTVLEPSANLRLGDLSTTAFPQWLPPAQSLGQTITSQLLLFDNPQNSPAIRLIEKPFPFAANWTPKLDALVTEAKAKNATALVVAIDHSADGLFVSNQHSHDAFPIPVVLIAKRDLNNFVSRASQASGNAQLQIAGRLVDAQSINVVGKKSGVGKAIVISTPLTGWFQCGGERGPGIALWLHVASVLAKYDRPVLMLGTGSHEVGHFGMEHALAHGAPKPDDVALWVHLGASLGATKLDAQHKFKSPQALIARPTSEAFAKTHLSANLPIYVPGTKATLGEAGQVIGAGHERFVGMSGFFPGFHTPEDLGQAVDYAALEALSKNVVSMIGNVKD
jgi:hypothetical protein